MFQPQLDDDNDNEQDIEFEPKATKPSQQDSFWLKCFKFVPFVIALPLGIIPLFFLPIDVPIGINIYLFYNSILLLTIFLCDLISHLCRWFIQDEKYALHFYTRWHIMTIIFMLIEILSSFIFLLVYPFQATPAVYHFVVSLAFVPFLIVVFLAVITILNAIVCGAIDFLCCYPNKLNDSI